MQRAALALAALVAAALVVAARRRFPVSGNVAAFLAMIRQVEARGEYNVIAGGDHFTDYSEHPFVVNRDRVRPLNTTASGAYQMVRKTWAFARDALELPDFTPESQDRAAAWLLEFKEPGADVIAPGGTGNIELVRAGRFDEALEAYRLEWESFDKIINGRYPWSRDQAAAAYEGAGGSYA